MRNFFERTFLILGMFVKIVVTPAQQLAQQVINRGTYVITITVKTRAFVIQITPSKFRPAMEELLTWKGLSGLAMNFVAFFLVNKWFIEQFHPQWPAKIFWTALAYIAGGFTEYFWRRLLGTKELLLLSVLRWMAGAGVFSVLFCTLELIHPATSWELAKLYSIGAGLFGIVTEGIALAQIVRFAEKRQNS